MRRLKRLLLSLLVVAGIILGFAGWRVLWYQAAPSVYPPPATAVTAAAAPAVAARIAQQQTVSREDLTVDLAPSHAASMQLYIDGKNFYPALLADMKAARSSIHFEQYGFDPGQVSDQFVPVLTDKARNGVDVRMIVDRFGSAVDTHAKDMYTTLAASGAQVTVNYPFVLSRVGLYGGEQQVDWRFQQLGHFYHRKVFIIDGQIGWVGGAGIEDWFYDGSFHDVFVRITGDAVAQLQLNFLLGYRFHGGPLPTGPGALDKYFPGPIDGAGGAIPTTFVTNVPGEDHRAVTDAIWNLIENAHTRLDIIDPYVADSGTLARIMAAARRGVHVRFIVPQTSNSPPVQWALEHHFADLQDAGVQVYLQPVLPHAKVVLADDRVVVGSTNLDAWALYRNWETSLVFDDPQVATTFETQLFDPDVASSMLATPPTGLRRLWDALFFLLSPLL